LRSVPGKLLLREDQNFNIVSQKLSGIISSSGENGITRTVESLFSIFQDVVREVRLEKLVIVIDRIDQVWGYLNWFLRPMLLLFKGEERQVKFFLTVRDQTCTLASRLREDFGRGALVDLMYDQDAT
jgi:hypothetical protein